MDYRPQGPSRFEAEYDDARDDKVKCDFSVHDGVRYGWTVFIKVCPSIQLQPRQRVQLTLHNLDNSSRLQLGLLRVVDAHALEYFGRLSNVIIHLVVSFRPLHDHRGFASIHVTGFHPFDACELRVRESDTASV